jgi:starch synthase
VTAKKSSAAKNNKILFVTSEAHPLIKTGGLGDVSGALPVALKQLKQDVRLILPAYRDAMRRYGPYTIASLVFPPETHPIRLLEGRLPDSNVMVWLVDIPSLFDRTGNPYLGPDGHDWPDNALRFGMFARAVTAIALNQAGLDWSPDIVHCNDWQTGLIPPLLSLQEPRPTTVFTIHNLAYQGLFPADQFQELGLPPQLWGMDGLEFYDQLSFIKGGLLYADMINTVSPTYAKEICTPEFGCSLDGLLRNRADRLKGILNGADYGEWDPRHDTHLTHHYGPDTLQGKAANKTELQNKLGLQRASHVPLVGFVGRLASQKGIDLILAVLGNLLHQEVQFVILGTGDKDFEKALTELAALYPHRCHVKIGFSEQLAHHIEAAADLFLMPSRYEPCGLNQIYSMRYGTLPIVRRTGGLADTVVDVSAGLDSATGFVFDEAAAAELSRTIQRALALYRDHPQDWRKLMHNAMSRDYSWRQSALAYLDLYQQALAHREQEISAKAV